VAPDTQAQRRAAFGAASRGQAGAHVEPGAPTHGDAPARQAVHAQADAKADATLGTNDAATRAATVIAASVPRVGLRTAAIAATCHV
jgi:hypothetical protein